MKNIVVQMMISIVHERSVTGGFNLLQNSKVKIRELYCFMPRRLVFILLLCICACAPSSPRPTASGACWVRGIPFTAFDIEPGHPQDLHLSNEFLQVAKAEFPYCSHLMQEENYFCESCNRAANNFLKTERQQ
jgi:hypothetical protein